MSNTDEFFTGFGPEDTDWEQIHVGDAGLILLDSHAVEGGPPPVPQQVNAPSITSPTGEPPNYVDPRDKRRVEALAPRTPGPAPGQPIDTGQRIVIHHIHEGMTRGAESAIIHQVPVVGSTPVQIMGKSDVRTRATIVNNGMGSVYLGMDDSVVASGFNSFTLASSASLDIRHRDQMWAVCASGSTAALSIIETISERSPTQLGDVQKPGVLANSAVVPRPTKNAN